MTRDYIFKSDLKIQEVDDDKRLCFGWASIIIDKDGNQVVDHQQDLIEPDELENAAYRFVEHYREGGEMHERGGTAVLIESLLLTKEKAEVLGVPPGTLPECGWWVGFKITDDEVWNKIKDGTYTMFSIEGKAIREEI